ncbi:MAG: hypothetical protein P8K76_12035 [Candidatus Binatia bacterium]|nr:hypothetical protein [Candidatus Binatia bacterium]MDG1959433.1 hypothetical protein [Candidatus Binatia bacterium]MDG2010505.1 hypothetical protein [Candidatus Binatia bacterium]
MNLLPPWERARYQLLDSLAARSMGGTNAYVHMISRVEEVLQRERSRTAINRISRALDLAPRDSRQIYRQCLASEAREEADSARLLVSGQPIAEAVEATPPFSPVDGPCIYITLHWGSPMITFLYLRSVLGIPVRLIGRPLDKSNPLPPGKMRWGHRKVEWMETLTGETFIPDDGAGALQARTELLEGRSIFASVDVPAQPTSRSRVIDLFGEPIRIASGLLRLAALTKVPLVPILGHSCGQKIHVAHEEPIPAAREEELAESIGIWLRKILARQPDQWWLWPFVHVEKP